MNNKQNNQRQNKPQGGPGRGPRNLFVEKPKDLKGTFKKLFKYINYIKGLFISLMIIMLFPPSCRLHARKSKKKAPISLRSKWIKPTEKPYLQSA
mgnify:CR=1 FL=1